MIAFSGTDYLQHILFAVVSGHGHQLTIIKPLIAELNNLGMATIVLPQQRDRSFREYLHT